MYTWKNHSKRFININRINFNRRVNLTLINLPLKSFHQNFRFEKISIKININKIVDREERERERNFEKLLATKRGWRRGSQINYIVPSSWLNKKLSEFHGMASQACFIISLFCLRFTQVLERKYARTCHENISSLIFLKPLVVSWWL